MVIGGAARGQQRGLTVTGRLNVKMDALCEWRALPLGQCMWGSAQAAGGAATVCRRRHRHSSTRRQHHLCLRHPHPLPRRSREQRGGVALRHRALVLLVRGQAQPGLQPTLSHKPVRRRLCRTAAHPPPTSCLRRWRYNRRHVPFTAPDEAKPTGNRKM